MPIIVTVPPTGSALTTVARVQAELGLSGDDILLSALIEEASSAIIRECGWPFGLATYVETMKGSNSQYLGLSRVPIVSVSEVLEDGVAVAQVPATPWSTPSEDNYYLDDLTAGSLFRPIGWGRTTGLKMWGWESFASGYILPGGNSLFRYQVTYQAGYTLPSDDNWTPAFNPTYPAGPQPLPGAVQRACIETVKAWWFARAQDTTVQSESTGDERVVYNNVPTQAGSLPSTALALLRTYRRVN